MRQFIPNRDRGAAGGSDAPRTSPHGMPLEGQGPPGRRSHLRPTDTHLPDPHLTYDITGRRRDRTGLTGPGGRSLSDIRIFLASVFAPVLLVGAAILAFAASLAAGGSSARSTLVWLAVACFVLSVGAALDVAQSVWRRRRRERQRMTEAPPYG
ncbi:hypothetical protein C7M71_004105 [Peterkaempfera bronchialis]|uniref:Uncharacterized protein n=2 Tax=Peterkaempfera bronchialis TaxID=2126346 RepID=A0A345SSQ7_9ACTN|nr:hypothetical protein C7M71_004105 [Peterkaempfera bronchialis]